MADSAQAWTWTEGSGGLNLVSTISQFVKNPVGRLVELKRLSVFVIDDEGLQCQQTISIYIGFVPGSCSPKPEVEAPTTLRGGDGGEHRDEASGPGLPLLSDALLHSGNTEDQEAPHEVVQLRQ